MELTARFTNLGSDTIQVLHFRAGIFHKDHSLTILQPLSIRCQCFRLYVLLKLPKGTHLLSIKSLCHLLHPGVRPGQAKTFSKPQKEGKFAFRLHLSRIIKWRFQAATPAFIGEVAYTILAFFQDRFIE